MIGITMIMDTPWAFDLDGKGTTSDPVKCHVKKNTDVTAIAPNVVANTGLRHTGWNKPLKGKFSVDTTIKAQVLGGSGIQFGDQRVQGRILDAPFTQGGLGVEGVFAVAAPAADAFAQPGVVAFAIAIALQFAQDRPFFL